MDVIRWALLPFTLAALAIILIVGAPIGILKSALDA